MSERTALSIAIVTTLALGLLYGVRTGKLRATRRPAILPSTPVVATIWLILVVVLFVANH